jgi:hypothetical protein
LVPLVPSRHWHRHFFYRKECLKTTWKLRVGLVAAVLLVPLLTRSLWVSTVASSLTCEEQVRAVDAILIDNFDRNYLLFERAATLYNAGHSTRVLLPAIAEPHADGPTVEQGFVAVMVRISHLKTTESIPVKQVEPISIGVAYQIRDYLTKEHIKSIMVVTTGLRAKRALLIYSSVLGRAGISVSCVPVFGTITPDTWTDTLHGIQEVTLQLVKLLYYRTYVLPFHSEAE